jgi:polysaccharide export outer membrane protein
MNLQMKGRTEKYQTNTYINTQHIFFILLLTGMFFQACVPNKRLVYLQYEEDFKDNPFPSDSIVRTYDLKRPDYRLNPNDIISLRVASITPEEFNFIRQYEQQLGQIRKLSQYQQGLMQQGNNQFMNQMGMRGGGGGNNQGVMGDPMVSALLLDQMQSGFVLDPTGSLDLPRIGTVNLTGLTIEEAESKIKGLLDGFFETPMVRIQLLSFHFTIVGEVNQEGRYTSFDPNPNIFDAIMLAGNLSEFADRSNIKIVRQQNGQARIIYLNTLAEKTLAAEHFFLQPDDLIIVPPLEARTTRTYTFTSASTIVGVLSGALSLVLLLITLNNR